MRKLVGNPWFYPLVFIGFGILFAVWGTAQSNAAVIAAGVLMALFSLPYLRATRVRSRPFAGAEEHVAGGGVAVFWRPGCQYCMQLIKTLSREEKARVYWVNIWQEPDAAAFLEQLHLRRDGRPHQAVPTAWTRRQDWIVASEKERARLQERLRQTKEVGA